MNWSVRVAQDRMARICHMTLYSGIGIKDILQNPNPELTDPELPVKEWWLLLFRTSSKMMKPHVDNSVVSVFSVYF